MEDSESKPTILRRRREPRLVVDDRGPWIFALYWYSFRFHLRGEPPQRAMSFFGLSSALRSVLLENERTATLARRFDMRSRVLMALCFIPGILSLSAFIVLCGLYGDLIHRLREQFPWMVAVLAVLALLAMTLMAILTKDLHRSFAALFAVYNASDESSEAGQPDLSIAAERLDSNPAEPPEPSDPAPSASAPNERSDPPASTSNP